MSRRNSELQPYRSEPLTERFSPPYIRDAYPREMYPPEREDTIDVRDMLRILRRRVPLILTCCAVMCGVAIFYLIQATPLFTATTSVFIDPRHQNVVDKELVVTNMGTEDSAIESQVQLIQSGAVVRRVIQRLGLLNDREFGGIPAATLASANANDANAAPIDPSAAFEVLARDNPTLLTAVADNVTRRLKVNRQGTTSVAEINFTSGDPTKAAQIANAVAEAYLADEIAARNETTRVATEWLNGQIQTMREHVRDADRAVEAYRVQNNLVAAKGATVTEQQITDLSNQLILARAQTAEAKAKLENGQRISKNGGDAGETSEVLNSDVISKLRGQYADLSSRDAELSSKYGEKHPAVANVRAQMRDVKRQIDKEVQRISGGTKNDFEVARSREASLQASLNEVRRQSDASSQAQVRLRELEREADASRQAYETFLARYKQTSGQDTLQTTQARIVAPANIPLSPSSPKKVPILGAASAIGLGLGAMLAFLADYLDPRIRTPGQLEREFGLTHIASVPAISAKTLIRRARRRAKRAGAMATVGSSDPTRVTPAAVAQNPILRYAVDEPMSPFAEAVRAIRLAVQRTSREQGGNVVQIASASENEGKSALACNLAQHLARAGLRTVLIDADLRNPSISRQLCPKANLGLREVAAETANLEDVLVLDPSTGLRILPALNSGNTSRVLQQSAEILGSEAMSRIVSTLRQTFDVVIIDTSPLLPLVDPRVVAELFADQIILVVEWGRTKRDAIGEAVRLLTPVEDRLIGAVLTKVDTKRIGTYGIYQGPVSPEASRYFRVAQF